MEKPFDMTPESIRQYWKFENDTPAFHQAKWEKSVDTYAKMELPTESNSLAMRVMRREGILDTGGTCLDVGCGAGRFSFALEKAGFQATGTDFSQGMIDACRSLAQERGSSARFSLDDWHTLDLRERGWEKQFDFVLCHMSPAIRDADTFQKLMDAAKHAVLMLRPTRWVYKMEREIMKLLGRKPEIREGDRSMAYAYSLAWLMGYAPIMDYEDSTMEFTYSLEQARSVFREKLSQTGALTPSEERQIDDYLSDHARDGLIHEEAKTQIFSMFWRVDGPNPYR